jgi:hypothetical protein
MPTPTPARAGAVPADRPVPRHRATSPIRKWWIFTALAGILLTLLLAANTMRPGRTSAGAPPVTTAAAEEQCRFTNASADVPLTPQQAANAATIVGVALNLRLPERASVIAVATALQESSLHNLDHGDRDSLGLFQQRPSQGWGTPDQIRDPVYATRVFLKELQKVPGYQTMPLSRAAQEVQRSAHPDAYATREADAATITGSLLGGDGATVTCHTRTGALDGTATPLRCGPDAGRPRLPGLVAMACALEKDPGSDGVLLP